MFGAYPFGAGYFGQGPGAAPVQALIPAMTRARGIVVSGGSGASGLHVESASHAVGVKVTGPADSDLKVS